MSVSGSVRVAPIVLKQFVISSDAAQNAAQNFQSITR